MSYVERLNTAHRRFRADIASRAVPDFGIDLNRKIIPIAHIEEAQEVPVIVAPTVVPEPVKAPTKVSDIIRIVAAIYDTPAAILISGIRTFPVVRVRHLAMYAVREIMNKSHPEIGRRFGNRDHTTSLHAVHKIQKLRAENPTFDAEVTALLENVRQRLS